VVSITNGNSVTVYDPKEGTVPVEPQPAIKIEKTGPDFVPAGGTAEYHITVTNTGNVPLTDVRVDDNCGGVSKEYTYTGTLAPGGVWGFDVECTTTWESPGQIVTNTATASGKYGGTPVTATDSANLYAFILRKKLEGYSNGNPPSFSFKVMKDEREVGTFTITGAGNAEFFLGEGTYTIIEDSVPDGWSTQYSGGIPVTTGSGNWYGDWTITNTYTGGSGGGGGTVPTTGTVSGKICQHNGKGYGEAWVHFRNVQTGEIFDAQGDKGPGKNGKYTIQLPPGRYVMWADKPTGGQCPTSIGYDPSGNPAQSPGGYICLTVEAGKTYSYDIWVKNTGNNQCPAPTPPSDACPLSG
jgi:hypothetical protein